MVRNGFLPTAGSHGKDGFVGSCGKGGVVQLVVENCGENGSGFNYHWWHLWGGSGFFTSFLWQLGGFFLLVAVVGWMELYVLW